MLLPTSISPNTSQALFQHLLLWRHYLTISDLKRQTSRISKWTWTCNHTTTRAIQTVVRSRRNCSLYAQNLSASSTKIITETCFKASTAIRVCLINNRIVHHRGLLSCHTSAPVTYSRQSLRMAMLSMCQTLTWRRSNQACCTKKASQTSFLNPTTMWRITKCYVSLRKMKECRSRRKTSNSYQWSSHETGKSLIKSPQRTILASLHVARLVHKVLHNQRFFHLLPKRISGALR